MTRGYDRPDSDDKGRCKKCKKRRTKKGHDPCIANLPGVEFACCGHGVEEGYVVFNNGQVIRGHFDHMTDQELWRKKLVRRIEKGRRTGEDLRVIFEDYTGKGKSK